MSPRSALPEHINDNDEIENSFPDDSQYGGTFGKVYRWINKKTKTWFAFSHRSNGWAKWRKYPVVIFKVGGSGPWRYEAEEGENLSFNHTSLSHEHPSYLSRIQYYKRWHFAIQWPLIVTFHFYPNAKDVPKHGEPRPDLDGKVWFAYWNHFDADLVYWMFTSLYIGRNWK